MRDPPRIVLCAPVALAPYLPQKALYSTYEKTPCPVCNEEMWMGARSKTALETGKADHAICMECAIVMGLVDRTSALTMLTSGDQ